MISTVRVSSIRILQRQRSCQSRSRSATRRRSDAAWARRNVGRQCDHTIPAHPLSRDGHGAGTPLGWCWAIRDERVLAKLRPWLILCRMAASVVSPTRMSGARMRLPHVGPGGRQLDLGRFRDAAVRRRVERRCSAIYMTTPT
jgi:hypothetical protein